MAEGAKRRLGQEAVEAAIRAFAGTRLKTQSDSMLRVFLGFKAVRRDGEGENVSTNSMKKVVEELFVLLPTPAGVREERYSGTISLRGSKGAPLWLRNDAYRGSFIDYAGPSSPGRILFEDEDWHKPLLPNAVEPVAATLGNSGYVWPPADALAIIALRNRDLDPHLTWDQLIERGRERFGLSPREWEMVTSSPALDLDPFHGVPWDPDNLADDLCPPGLEQAEKSEAQMETLPEHLREQVERVVDALSRYGQHAIVALAGVPGTSKSYTARRAAAAFASEGCVREIQFSPGYTYEEFIEGPRYGDNMKVQIEKGIFLDLNEQALEHPELQYVLLIEELTRADIPRVLGELLTYIEYRSDSDSFTTLYGRANETRIAPNVAILATYNPSDRSAVSIDAALLRRMRILDFPPHRKLLVEILADNGLDKNVIDRLVTMFDACEQAAGPDHFSDSMPFGHAVFSSVESEGDLYNLWHEELKRMLIRAHAPAHELYEVIAANYPWRESRSYSVVSDSQAGTDSDGGAAR
ncbi:MAG TPA: AAA family ATPase [Solirubrobacterales bacterium]|nr:AAA family ATPase [Solirubrobacterales bacterium]